MRNWVWKITILVVIVAIVAVVEYFILRQKEEKNELTLFGNVDVRLVDIGFRVAGQVEKLCFEEGDVVKTGQLLAVLNKTPYDSQLEESISAVSVVEANLKNAEILLNRRKELIGVGGVSQEDLDNAQASYNQLYAAWEEAKSAEAVQRDNLSYTKVYAPTEGIILTRIREPGTVVNPGDPVYTVSVASPVWIRAYVDEPDLGKIYFGMPAEIYTDTKGGPVYTGKIGFISPMAEFTPKTVETLQLRTDLVYRIRIYADNPDWRLKQGMPVTIKLKTGQNPRQHG